MRTLMLEKTCNTRAVFFFYKTLAGRPRKTNYFSLTATVRVCTHRVGVGSPPFPVEKRDEHPAVYNAARQHREEHHRCYCKRNKLAGNSNQTHVTVQIII